MFPRSLNNRGCPIPCIPCLLLILHYRHMAPNVWTDRVSRRGHWGEVTSTLDWCEENYVVVQFIAEFWNTVSNILLIILPLFIVYSVAVQRLGLVYIVGVLSVSVVGLGSLLFHGTLLYEMQLMDELPMLIAGAFLAFIMLTITLSDDSVWRLVIGCVLSVFCVVAIWVYLVVKDPLFHEACYGLLVSVCVIYILYTARSICTTRISATCATSG